MKFVIAPDSFKGSLSAPELSQAIHEGILEVFPQAHVREVPLADGGEGTVENLVYATNGHMIQVPVHDPLHRKIRASYGVLGDGQTVIIEMAQASGLPLLTEDEQDPLRASSYGTGELIKHALDQGYRQFMIGLGGSATNDGGAGMLNALGLQFYDEQGSPLCPGGVSLANLSYFDESNLDKRLQEAQFTIASDVNNPLCGKQGASAVFGPQKGATQEMVQQLDQALLRYAQVIFEQKRIDITNVPGAGAAGGMGASLLAFFDATMRSGIELFLEAVHFQEKLEGATMIMTGEGKLDGQTLSGKAIAGVCKEAKRANTPVIALCGAIELNHAQLDELGLTAAFSIVNGPCELAYAQKNAYELVRHITIEICNLIKMGMRLSLQSADETET